MRNKHFHQIQNQKWSLQILGNLAASQNPQHTEAILICVPHLYILLDDPSRDIRHEVAWILSNISSGTTHQVQILFENDIIDAAVSIIQDNVQAAVNENQFEYEKVNKRR
ncbi:MAG: hypothetical protein EZS28_045898, partial [Streblomastix strix]